MLKKKIKLSNEKEFNRFYKLLPLYNSILFKFIYFDINETNDSNIKIIKKILNEKNRRKKLELIIDESCNFIDDYFQGENICGFKNCKCYAQRQKGNKFKNGCCRKCLYQSITGCKTKNVACKLFFCSEVYTRRKILKFEDVKIFNCLSYRQKFMIKSDYFSKKEDVIMDLYFNSLIIGTIRIVIRLLINLYKFNKLKTEIDK